MQAHSLRDILKLAYCIAVAMSLFVPAGLHAEIEGKRFGQEILEILRDEGKIDDERYEELRKLEQAEHSAEQQIPAQDPEAYRVTYKNGLNFQRNDGYVKIKFGGRIQADFATIHVDSDLTRATDGFLGGPIGGDGEGVEFRRTRLYVSGDLYDRIVFKSQFDFAGGSVSLKDQYIGMKNIPHLGTVLVGHMKEPFSLEQLTSSKYITFMERSLPSILDSVRNFGLLFKNHYLDKRMTASAGIFAITGDDGEFFSREEDFNLSGRITGLPLYDKEKNRLVHIGFSLIHRFSDKGSGGFALRPEIHQAQKYLRVAGIRSDGGFRSDYATFIAAEVATVLGPFSVQSEWKNAWIDNRDGENWEVNSFYVEMSYFLTGESRTYKTSSGTFGRVTPNRPFNPATGDWGAWQIAARYSWIDLQDSGTNGGEEQNVTLALSWHLYSNVRLQFNYTYADIDDTGDVLNNASGDIHAFQTRVQLEF